MMLASRSAADAMEGMAWLYGEQKELTLGAAMTASAAMA